MDSADREILLAVYKQVSDSWRVLTDVRFKLLALIPPVAALALVAVVTEQGPLAGSGVAPRVGLATFGLLVTVGLRMYDLRNDELYDDLISRGRRAEFELGVHAGVFLARPEPKKSFGLTLVRHRTATSLVYGSVILAWIAAGLYAAVFR